MAMTKKERAQDKLDAVSALRDLLTAGQEISVITTTVSASGMSRGLRFFIAYKHGCADYHGQLLTPFESAHVDRGRGESTVSEITWLVARTGAAGMKLSRDERSAVIGGCGMNMHFHAIDCLAHAIGLPLRHRSL